MSALVKMKLGKMTDRKALIRALTLMCADVVQRHLRQDVEPTGRYIQGALKQAGVTRADVLIEKAAFAGYADLAFAKTADVFQAYFDDMDQHKIEEAFRCDRQFGPVLEQYYAAACAEQSLLQQGYTVEVAYDKTTQKVDLQAYAYA